MPINKEFRDGRIEGSPKTRVLGPRLGYNRAAIGYERRWWFDFWTKYEVPVVKEWLTGLPRGVGLDAGSGTGLYVKEIVKLKQKVVAVDISGRMIDINQRKHAALEGRGMVHYVLCDIRRMPFADQSFDWVLCTRVLSHVANVRNAIRELGRVLKQGGSVFIADVHPNHPYSCVSIDTNEGLVKIPAYHHSLGEYSFLTNWLPNLRIKKLCEYRLEDLKDQPIRARFKMEYPNSSQPIFYTCELEKTDCERPRKRANTRVGAARNR